MFDMNSLNLIFIGVIFLSLAVIIGVLGKNARKIKELQELTGRNVPAGSPERPGKARKMLEGSLNVARGALIVFAEWIVKHAKKLLHLVHFWLIKHRRNGKGNEVLDDIEAKEELVIQEERSLDKVINEDLGNAEEENVLNGAFTVKELGNSQANLSQSDSHAELTKTEDKIGKKTGKESKIKRFFLSKIKSEAVSESVMAGEDDKAEEAMDTAREEEIFSGQKPQEEAQKGRIRRFLEELSFFSKRRQLRKPDETDQEGHESATLGDYFEDEFSDGVVKIEKPVAEHGRELLMEEVVVAKHQRQQQIDMDDELGIDRGILEKKILQKIAENPRNIEHYRQLGELYIKMRNFSDAEDTYKFIIKSSPRDVDAKRKIEKIKLLKRLG